MFSVLYWNYLAMEVNIIKKRISLKRDSCHLHHSHPHSPFVSLSRLGLGMRKRRALGTLACYAGYGDTGFAVLDSRTSGLHVCSHDVSKECMRESLRFLLLFRNSLFQRANKKVELIQKSYVPRALCFLVPRPSLLRETKGLWGREFICI